jgi:hypothetical protein
MINSTINPTKERLNIVIKGDVLKFNFKGDIDNKIVSCFEDEVKIHKREFKNMEVDITETSQYESKVGRIIEVVNHYYPTINKLYLRDSTYEVITKFNELKIKPQLKVIKTNQEGDFRNFIRIKTLKEIILPNVDQSKSLSIDKYDGEVIDVKNDCIVLCLKTIDGEKINLKMHREVFAEQGADFKGALVKYLTVNSNGTIKREIILLNPQIHETEHYKPVSYQNTKELFLKNIQKQ